MAESTILSHFLRSLEAKPDPRSLAWDTSTLESLSPSERILAEDALIERALHKGDLRAIKSLGKMGATRALDALETLRDSPSPMIQNAAMRALALLNGDQDLVAELVESLGGQVDAFSAWDLKSMSGPEAFKGLLVALQSSDLPARIHALDGLCEKSEVAHLRVELQTPIGRYQLLLGARYSALYLPAAHALADIFVQLQSGVSAEMLDLVYAPSADPNIVEAFWESCGFTGKPYETSYLSAMGAHDLAWAHALIVARVEEKDERSLDAIIEHELTWSIPVLEACLADEGHFDEAYRQRLQETLDALNS